MVDVDQQGSNDPVKETDSSTELGDGSSLPQRRGRSSSVASTQPSVETVVSKAKRAASTLLTLLHAKNCFLSTACVHPGCREAKLLHLHLKTCAAGENFPCPSSHHGCDQARQLLAHYRRCRNSRARQAGNLPSRRDTQQQPVCLICSLVARQARSILDTGSSSSSASSSGSSRSLSSTPVKRTGGNKRIVASFMLDGDNMVMPPPPPPPPPPSPNGPKMPPPPPRSVVPTSLVEPLPLTGASPQRGGNPTAAPVNASFLSLPPFQSEKVSGHCSPVPRSNSNKYKDPAAGSEDEDSPPQGNDSDERTTETTTQCFPSRSASVGGATFLLSSNTMVSSPCATINEERPTTATTETQSFDFDDTPYKY